MPRGFSVINAASKILLHIFLPDLDSALRDHTGMDGFAVSPVTILDEMPAPECPRLEVTIGVAAGEHHIVAGFLGFGEDIRESLSRYAENLPGILRLRAGILLKKKLPVRAVFRTGGSVTTQSFPGRCAEIRMIRKGDAENSSIRAHIPFPVLELVSRDLNSAVNEESLERSVIDSFREPTRILPDLNTLMDVLDNRELRDLFYQLQKSRLLTTYQLCLIVTAFPEHALRVKRCLSAHTVQDVSDMMKLLGKGRAITRRDVAEGVYSVEESIYTLMKRGSDLRYAPILRDHQAMVADLAGMELLLRIDFSAWLKRMEEDSLLYYTLAAAGERDIASALSDDHGRLVALLEKNISTRRAAEIANLAKGPCTLEERLSARSRMVSIYRALRIKRRNWGAESFEYLLRSISHQSDYRRLLLEAGWFTLSTALKGAKPAIVKKVTDHLPSPARFLIEDVLRGVVNPNILHDELQVDAARRRCVEAMLALEEEGVVTLHE